MHIANSDKPVSYYSLDVMIAESSPADKDLVVRLVVNLINKEN